MQIKEEKVTLEKAEEIFNIIGKTLAENFDTQVFVADSIIDELRRETVKHHVYSHNYEMSGHYTDRNMECEIWLELTIGYPFETMIARGSFIQNCKGYKQLVLFKEKGDDYRYYKYKHFDVGMQQILIINVL